MKLLKCEVCGSSELTKDDGLFVCDYCGAKYALDEVRKMVEASNMTVNGAVSIDSSSRLRSFVQAAYDGYDNLNFDNLKKYAEEALYIDPNNADALCRSCRDHPEMFG